MQERLKLYLLLIRWDKPVGTLLLLWPTLWALWIAANGVPPLGTLIVFVLGTFLMRSAGCAINDYADRDFDRYVQRTEQRVLTSGKISAKEAVAVAVILSLMAFALVLTQNALTVQLSFAALAVAATYPFFKRFFPMPQLVLGVAFSFGIPMAFAAVQGGIPPMAWGLFAANLIWTLGYDTAYAMADKPDDLKLGLKTSAITFGRFDAAAVMVCHILFIGMMALAIEYMGMGLAAWIGLAVAAALCGVQAPKVFSRDRAACFAAFKSNHWVGLALFAGIALQFVLR